MNDNEKEFEDFVRQIKFDDSPDPSHRDKLEQDLLGVMSKQPRRKETPLIIWRTIMKSSITKLAAVAAVILIAVLSITILDKSTTPAWAIEQTIEALKKFNAVHISGAITSEDGEHIPFNLWATANQENTQSENFRLELDDGQIRTVQGNDTYHYDPNTNTVRIIRGERASISPWIGPDLFYELQNLTQDWKVSYGTDPATGRERAFVTCSYRNAKFSFSRAWWFEFDIESKLLVRFKQWHKLERDGHPDFDATKIVFYEDLPSDKFEFKIPEGAEIKEELSERALRLLNDPNFGLLVDDLTEDEASAEIVRLYWDAVINANWESVENLRPFATADDWQKKYSTNLPRELLEVGKPYQQEGCSIGPVVPCNVRFEDSTVRNIKMIVKFREIDDNLSCVIAGTWGGE